jgi:predicted metal-binding membrane protein
MTGLSRHPPVPLPLASSERSLYFAALLAFLASAALTLYFCRSMSGGMSMPGGWTMSMMWMLMPGQTQFAAALMFLEMWLAMMVAMMLPSALPMLVIYRRAAAFRGDRRAGAAVTLLASGYFAVWLAFGAVVYAAGMAIAFAAMRWDPVSRSIPAACGASLVICGIYQLTPWKGACLRHCRDLLSLVAGHLHAGPAGAFLLGIHHGAFCLACCWSLMLMQMVLGVMNLWVMVAVAAIIALEKLLPRAQWIVRLSGAAAMVGGAVVLWRCTLLLG